MGQQALAFTATQYVYNTYRSAPADAAQGMIDSFSNKFYLGRVANALGVNTVVFFEADHVPESLAAARSLLAVVGVLYQEKGPKAVQAFFEKYFVSHQTDLERQFKLVHPKTLLASISSSKGLPRPVARVLKQPSKVALTPVYTVGLFSNDQLIGQGFGLTPELAESRAARSVIEKTFKAELAAMTLEDTVGVEEEKTTFLDA
ncbi:39S ribosomal protein L44, mitochondrial [Rhizophlyctis rosea]|uniref:Large ribosomal subunit protein mL44 n=1 Tax=Rhizophlyctis rosea TaxID=64517 RepID=A0AAD5SG79_9FUNG|nr:39S ribosomal protein L44, mitochondrial [Rhizophlyctis rosea]